MSPEVCKLHEQIEVERHAEHTAIMAKFERGEVVMEGLRDCLHEIKESLTGTIDGDRPGVLGQLRLLTIRVAAVENTQQVVGSRVWELFVKFLPGILGLIAGGALVWIKGQGSP